MLTDADGNKLTRPPAYASYFTNAYMPRRELMRARALAVLPPLAIVALLVAIWQLYANLSGIGDDVLPPPSRVLSVTWENRGDLWSNTLPTLRATLLGFALSLAVGFVLAVLIDSWQAARRALMPVLITTQTLPIVAIAPLMVLWFGFGLTPKVLLVALVTFFPITVAFAEGFAASEPGGRGAAALDGRGPGAHLPLGALPDLDAVLLRRPPHRDHLRRGRRDLRRVRRRQRGPRDLHAERQELVPHRSRAGGRARSPPCSRSRCSHSPTRSSAIAIPWYRLSRQSGRER